MSSPMHEKFQAFEDEIRQRETPPPRTGGRWTRLLATGALLLAGFLVYRLPGSVPPPAWGELLQLVRMHQLFPLAAHLALLGRALAFLFAYCLWLYAAVRVVLLFVRPEPQHELPQSPVEHTLSREQVPARGASERPLGSPDQSSDLSVEKTSATSPGLHPWEGAEDQDRPAGAPLSSACLHHLVTQTSQVEKGRPEWPAVLLASWESIPIAQGEVGQGIGFAVAACCHSGRGRATSAFEDASLSALGVSWWAEKGSQEPLPLGLFLVANGGLVGRERDRYATGSLALQLLGQGLLPLMLRGCPPDDAVVERGLSESIQQANATLFQRAAAAGVGEDEVDTGFTGVLVLGLSAYIANVGNNRAYLYRPGGGLSQLTPDQAPSEEREGWRMQDSAVTVQLPVGQRYRGLGSTQEVEATLRVISLEVGDLLLLVSDGFWEWAEWCLLEQTLQWFANAPTADPFRLCSVLQEQALERGSVDHLSITVVQVVRLPAREEPLIVDIETGNVGAGSPTAVVR